jgi:hypothetical protein
MRFAILSTIALIAACAAGATTAPPSQSAAAAPVCLDVNQITNRAAISDEQIRFDMANGESWINTLKASCPGLRFNNGFSWDVTGGQVCSNAQTIYVLDRNTPCQLGEFTREP